MKPNTQKAPKYITLLLVIVGLVASFGLTYLVTPDKNGDGGMEVPIIYPFITIAVLVLLIACEKYFFSRYQISTRASKIGAIILITLSLAILSIIVNN